LNAVKDHATEFYNEEFAGRDSSLEIRPFAMICKTTSTKLLFGVVPSYFLAFSPPESCTMEVRVHDHKSLVAMLELFSRIESTIATIKSSNWFKGQYKATGTSWLY